MNILVFDIETILDIPGVRRLKGWHNLKDEEVIDAYGLARRQKTGNDFAPLHLHQIVAISLVLRTDQDLKVWSLGTAESDEQDLITRFFEGIRRFTPTLVSFNGSGFDLPVLHYRALKYKIPAPKYWEMGSQSADFKWNNYISRYHWRHTDLMDVLALYQNRAFVPLDELAALLGFPGKVGMNGGDVANAYHAGRIKDIRNYCETDVLNTYLLYLRFLLFKGQLDADAHETEEDLVRELLAASSQDHLVDFLTEWDQQSAMSQA